MIGLKAKHVVLIADDSATVRHILRSILEREDRDLEILEASNGDECSRLLQSGQIDIAFIDQYMPGMNGIDAIRQTDCANKSAFIVVMSANATDADIENARKAGVYEFLKKPFQASDVQQLLAQHDHISIMRPILIVDDSKVVRKLVRQVLENSQFNLSVSEAAHSDTACQLASRIPFNLALIDFNMPGKNGLETARLIRSLQPQARIILMTSEATPELVARARQDRLAGFLKKPFYREELDQILHLVLGLQAPRFDNSTPEEEPDDVVML
ncbi:response regulator [Coralliovum pocilloporae]|uniref:response regulator n=1 Tax=Coralliovum pocilloporae TaxID=3066369 RepID=UPI003306A4CC